MPGPALDALLLSSLISRSAPLAFKNRWVTWSLRVLSFRNLAIKLVVKGSKESRSDSCLGMKQDVHEDSHGASRAYSKRLSNDPLPNLAH